MENQDIFDQFTENRQTYTMDNSLQHLNNATAGCENTNVVSGEVENVSVGGEILGVKYDEHDVGDDDELKYVKEVQQSEKQQQQQLPLKNYSLGDGEYDSYEFVGKETAKGSHDFGNGNDEGAFVFGGEHLLQHQDMFSIGNGHNGHEIHENEEIATNTDFSSHASVEFEDRNPFDTEIEGFRAEGDFSSTSNNTESVEDFVPQVDVKIESKPEHQESQELGDEEEPSSVATNTTNGTSSLSENVPQPATSSGPASAFDDLMATLENKEIEDPLTPQRPDALNIDHQSILNPDAKEFIPSFGSNPSSPTSPFATGMQSSDLGEPMETQMYFGQQPSALPRHLLGDDDDFVAQSPRKGRGDNNMDSVPLPKELAEFEEEADKRPHELETKDVDVLHNRDGVMTPDQQVQQLPLDDIINDQENHDISSPQDITDFQPSSVMDHGPETSVDLDVDIDLQPDAVLAALHQDDDVMKRSMYVASDEAAIEDVLNSVQPIPTEIDSVNNSFIEESATESAAAQLANDKELLQVEEKEHVSHSPSTEEIQMNLQNTLNSSNKDIPQLPIDMDHADDMQEFMHEQQDQSHETQEQHIDTQEMQEQNIDTQEIQEQHIDTHEIQEQHIDTQETQEQHIDTMKSTEVSEESPFMVTDDNFSNNLEPQQQHEEINESYEPLNSLATDSKAIGFDVLTPSSTTDEKHLFEETKEETQEHQLYMEEPKEEQFFAEEPKEEQLLSVEPKQEQFFPEEPKAERVEEHNDAQMFSISGLEQQMSEMLLNNEGHLSELINSQVEEVSAPPAIDDESEHLISPDVAAVADEEDHSQQQKMIVDESFKEFEEKPIREQEQQQQQQLEQQEMHVEPVQEFIESPMHKQDLENEMVAVEEPLFEAKQTAPLFKTEETEIANEPKQEVVELCMVPETAPCEYLEQPQSPIMDVETQMVETVIEDLKPVELKEEEPKPEEVVTENILAAEEVKEDSSLVAAAAAVAATAALAATAAVVAVESKVAPSTTKKSEVAKKPLVKSAATTATTAKPKVGATTTAAKKPLDSAKKPTGLAAKPRLAPAKPASSLAAADKKPMTKPTTTTTARKPLGVGSVSASASKPAAKTTTTTSTTRTTARPTTAPRTTTTTTTTRKPITSTTTNGPAAKPRPATAPAKPTSLGLPATNGAAKTKVTSPRPMLSSTQSRKPAPPTLKSPLKTSSTNGVAKPTTTSTLASRTKTTTSSVSTTHGTTGTTGTTKTFTARPAPRSITSSSSTTTTTTTRRLTVGGTTAATTTTTTSTKTSGAPLRKSSPSKPLAGRTPTRPATTAGGLKSKTPITKKESPHEQRPAPIRKPVDKTIIPNGEAAANISKELNGTAEQQTLNGGGDMQQAVQQNGDSIIPNQTDVQQPFLEPRDEQIPMDLINA